MDENRNFEADIDRNCDVEAEVEEQCNFEVEIQYINAEHCHIKFELCICSGGLYDSSFYIKSDIDLNGHSLGYIENKKTDILAGIDTIENDSSIMIILGCCGIRYSAPDQRLTIFRIYHRRDKIPFTEEKYIVVIDDAARARLVAELRNFIMESYRDVFLGMDKIKKTTAHARTICCVDEKHVSRWSYDCKPGEQVVQADD